MPDNAHQTDEAESCSVRELFRQPLLVSSHVAQTKGQVVSGPRSQAKQKAGNPSVMLITPKVLNITIMSRRAAG